jgi:hypothetical protein
MNSSQPHRLTSHTTSGSGRFLSQCFTLVSIVVLSLCGNSASAIAQDSNFGNFSLDPKTRGAVVEGTTGGSTSLSAITTNLDRDENQCFGFGDPKPDHILTLTQSIDRLKVLVDSRGSDTTLVIQAPDGSFTCADDFGNGKDAGIEATQWKPGKYKFWIGTVIPNQRHNYQLTVQAN